MVPDGVDTSKRFAVAVQEPLVGSLILRPDVLLVYWLRLSAGANLHRVYRIQRFRIDRVRIVKSDVDDIRIGRQFHKLVFFQKNCSSIANRTQQVLCIAVVNTQLDVLFVIHHQYVVLYPPQSIDDLVSRRNDLRSVRWRVYLIDRDRRSAVNPANQGKSRTIRRDQRIARRQLRKCANWRCYHGACGSAIKTRNCQSRADARGSPQCEHEFSPQKVRPGRIAPETNGTPASRIAEDRKWTLREH